MKSLPRLSLLLLPLLLPWLLQAQPSADKPGAGGPGNPLSPQEAQKQFKLDDGLRIELVACEPQIESPVAMQFAPDGRLWVVEMRDYPNGPPKGQPGQGRIRILEDKNGDGFFETSTIWADNLLFANGLLLWKDGAIVTMAPEIAYLSDTDGDGKADKKDVLYVGFAEQNPQLRVSHPILGLDGWIYCANGLRGGSVVPVSPNAKKYAPLNLSGLDFRFDPLRHDEYYEAITGPGQYGNTFDEWGNRFICDNRHHLRHVVMENRYLKRNPYLAAPALVEDVSILEDGPLSSGGKIYPLSRNWTTSNLHEGRFTAACGVFIYHGKLLDPSRDRQGAEKGHKPLPDGRGSGDFYRGAAFTCDPTGNLVHMEVLKPKGATFESRPHKKGVEFLATPDDWFRPVFLTHGPEGAMYVVDMYRAVIEHPEFMPPELKNRPDLWQGKDKGRIWRIVPKGHVTKTPRPNLGKAPIAELVKLLEHEEPWWRQTAQRLLLERNDKNSIQPLTKLFEETTRPQARILTAYLLEKLQALAENQVFYMLAPKTHPRVLEHGIRLAERMPRNQDLLNCGVAELRNDPDPRVRFQIALTLGGWKDWTSDRALIADRDHGDRWTRLAILSALPQSARNVWEEYLANFPRKIEPVNSHLVMARELAAMLAAAEKAPEFYEAFRDLPPKSVLQDHCLAGFADGLERRGKTLASIAADLPEDLRPAYAQKIGDVFTTAAIHVRDAKKSLEQRQVNLRIISHAPWAQAKQVLLPLAAEDTVLELRLPALRGLAAHADKDVPGEFMKLYPGATPSLRREILEAMLRQPARVHFLLDEIQAKRLRASELDPLRTRQLMNHADKNISDRARKLLVDNLPADRQKVLADFQGALNLKADAKTGRDIFKKNCATCHRVAGIGIDVGPDIADTRTKTPAALLNDILLPNAAIDANFINYLVTTKNGRTLTGLLTAETASSVTLRRAEGQSDVVLRQDIEEINSTGVSLMPDGMEKNIDRQGMADLIAFLKNWRYLDGSVPLGK